MPDSASARDKTSSRETEQGTRSHFILPQRFIRTISAVLPCSLINRLWTEHLLIGRFVVATIKTILLRNERPTAKKVWHRKWNREKQWLIKDCEESVVSPKLLPPTGTRYIRCIRPPLGCCGRQQLQQCNISLCKWKCFGPPFGISWSDLHLCQGPNDYALRWVDCNDFELMAEPEGTVVNIRCGLLTYGDRYRSSL